MVNRFLAWWPLLPITLCRMDATAQSLESPAGGTPTMRLALIEPLGDVGIGTYTYELAEGLVANGVQVDVYTSGLSTLGRLPRKHRFFPVLWSALFRQKARLASATESEPEPVEVNSASGSATSADRPKKRRTGSRRWRALRDTYLVIELVVWLRKSGYDLVWTQWPDMGRSILPFWVAARIAGLRVVHTAHNVFPHERHHGDHAAYRSVYKNSRLIITHSAMATRALCAEFPFAMAKVVTSRHGLYTCFPRNPAARETVRADLRIPPGQCVVLAFGSIRPYKNFDVLLDTLALNRDGAFGLIVAGHEFGFGDLYPNDPLGRTRLLINERGIADRVHLLPGLHSNDRAGELFEASDVIVLPYTESYGSGVLLLGMSFGKRVVVSRTGGMDEYVAAYGEGVVVEPNVDAVTLLAVLQTTRDQAARANGEPARPRELEWTEIAKQLLPHLERVRTG
jgi:glycosyltransferase involved in cell wall biosynthesis